jgi:hypothetical protein
MAKTENTNPEELRFNYLGFEYLPGKLKDFWTSEEEKQKYLKKVREHKGKDLSLERDVSIVNAGLLNKADRIIISLASIVMILSLFFPYYSFQAFGKGVSGIALSYIFNLGYVGNIVAWGGFIMKLTLAMSVILILISPAVGAYNLLALNTGQTKEDYYKRVKASSRLNIYALGLYLLFFILLSTGQANPFGSLGIESLGESLNLGSLISMAGFGIWANIGAHLLGMLPALEL